MIEKFFALPAIKQITPSISLRQYDELQLITVEHPNVRASIALQGAHLLSWKPLDADEVIWLSDKTLFHKGQALRGGVPICWPWFGNTIQSGLPSHGFARNMPWTLTSQNENEDGVALTFELQSTPETLKLWPHEFKLYAHFKLSHECEIELEAHGNFETTAALHSYFSVADINTVEVDGLGSTYIDKVLDGTEGSLSDGIQRFPDRTDRVYLNPEPHSIINDKRLNRTIHIAHHHNHNVVAWNPGPALSASMADLSDDAYQHFVCVETASVTSPLISTINHPAYLKQVINVNKK